MRDKFFIPVVFLFFFTGLQSQNFTLNKDNQLLLEYNFHPADNNFHTSIKPFLKSEIGNSRLSDSIDYHYKIKDEKNHLLIKPLYLFQTGYSLTDKKIITSNYYGAQVGYEFNKKWYLDFTLAGGNAVFPAHIDSFIKETDVVPGFGSAYKKNKAYSYQDFRGSLSYSPNKIFNFQIGRDKHFIGEGYRSLFLSDVATAYPFGKITANIWKIKYVSLFTAFKDVRATSHLKKDFTAKYGTFHYLSWNATKRLNFNFFESIIWQGSDSNRTRGYEVNYLNPVLFLRPAEYSIGSSDNALLGLGFRLKLFKKQQLYGQLLLDEFLLKEIKARNGWWANKFAIQAGFKNYDLFKIKNLFLQLEMNYVRPYTYSHGNINQNYGHYNQSLAHPFGANFIEAVSLLSYQYKRMLFSAKIIAAKYGADPTYPYDLNYGKNIYKSYTTRIDDYGNHTGQGITNEFLFVDLRLNYTLLKGMNLKLEAGITNRTANSINGSSKNLFIYGGLKTDLPNFYNDF